MSATMDIAIATRGVAYVALAGVLLAVAITFNDQRYPATPARKTELSPSVTPLDAGSRAARRSALEPPTTSSAKRCGTQIASASSNPMRSGPLPKTWDS